MTVRVALLLMLWIAGSAAAAAWEQDIPADAVSPLSPLAAVPLADGGFILGGDDRHRQRWLLRYDGDGNVLRQARGDDDVSAMRPAPDGGLEVLGTAPPLLALAGVNPRLACRLQRNFLGLDARFYDEWVLPAADQAAYGPLGPGRFAVVLDHSTRSRLSHFGVDCARNELLSLPGSRWLQVSTANGREAWALELGGSGAPRLHRVDRTQVRWSLPIAAADDEKLLATRAGEALLASADSLRRYRGDGSLRWQRSAPDAGELRHWGEDAGGPWLLYAQPSGSVGAAAAQTLVGLDADGEPRWRQSLQERLLAAQLPAVNANPLWLSAPAGSAAFDPASQGRLLLRQLEDGRLLPALSLEPGLRALAELASGDVLLALADGSIEQVDLRYGTRRALPSPRLPAPLQPLALHLDGDSVFVLAREPGAVRLQHRSADGALRWQRSLPAPIDPPIAPLHPSNDPYRLFGDAERFCLWRLASAWGQLTCLRRQDGSTLFGWVAAPAVQALPPQRSEDGGMQALVVDCLPADQTACGQGRLSLLRLDRQGRQIDRRELERFAAGQWPSLHVAADGLVVAQFDVATSTSVVSLFAADGARRWQRHFPGEYCNALGIGPNGTVLLEAEPYNPYAPPATLSRVMLLDHNGAPLWRRSLVAAAGHARRPLQTVALADGDWLVLDLAEERSYSRLTRLAGADGSTRWQQLVSAGGIAPSLHLAEAAGLVLLPRLDAPARTIGLRLRDGAAVTALHSAGSIAEPSVLALRADASLVLAVADPERGRIRLTGYAPTALQATVEPPSTTIRGIWHDPATRGQGFVLNEAAGNTYGAWLTFSRQGGHQHSEQRWYFLRGATGSRLTLYRHAGGRFAQPPVVPAEVVGEAELQRIDCERAALSYRFIANVERGLSDVIPLRRSAGECARDRAAMAGAWHEPTQSGQGLIVDELAVARRRQLAGAWLTYDPAGAADDPTAQHWFSVNGEIIGNAAELILYRTVGGSLDREATDNTWAVGRAHWRLLDCARAELHYEFAADAIAGAYAGRRGRLQLQRSGGCAE